MVAGAFDGSSSIGGSVAAAAGAATVAIVVELTVVHCLRKMQQQHHHQRTNGSTNMKTFTSPDNLDLFNLSAVFEVCDVGQGNLAIGMLLAKKIDDPTRDRIRDCVRATQYCRRTIEHAT